MPVSAQTPFNNYIGNGVTTAFAFSFLVLQAGDLVVKVAGVALVNGVGYTIAGVGAPAGGTVTMTSAPANGAAVAIYRSSSITRTTDYQTNGDFLADTVDADFDRLWLVLQELFSGPSGFGRMLKAPSGETLVDLPAAASRANTVQAYDSTGQPTVQVPSSGSAADVLVQLANGAVAGKGADLVSFKANYVSAVARLLTLKLSEWVSLLDFIPVAQHAAILAYTSTYDASTEINLALAAYPVVYAPAGLYRNLRPINMSARRSVSTYWGRRLIGAGANNTRFDSYTGNYPCIDCTGQNVGSVEGINFRSDNPPAGLVAADCASIGLQMGRGAVSTSCNQLYLFDLRFNMTSDMTRNAGNGTIGICNDASEHVIGDQIQIYANLPLVSHNALQFAVSRSSNIPTFGTQYEQPYAGAAISCTVHEWRNMQLISWDSYRAIWLHQVAGAEFPNLYTSTRKLVSLVPAQAESFYFTGSCANIKIHCYQEASGLFGATYRMDHRYLTYDGSNENIDLVVQRGVNDYGFTLPGAAVSAIHCNNGGYLANSRINCNYTIGIYNASGDNCGFAALPVTFTGTPSAWKNVDFTLDHSGSHSADIFSAIGTYCTNVNSKNYFGGDDYWGPLKGSWTPVAAGSGTAGAGTYSFQGGTYAKNGRTMTFSGSLAWSAHTGVGNLQITGLPLNADANVEQAVSVYYDGLTTVAGRQLVCKTVVNQGKLVLFVSDPGGGGVSGFAMDTAVTSLVVSGTIVIA